MKTKCIYALFFIVVMLAISCKSLKEFNKTFSKLEGNISEDLKTLIDEVKPIEDFTKRAVIGVFEGTADPSTLDNIDTITAKLSSLIGKYLNETLKNLNTEDPARNFVKGLKDSLFEDDTNEKINLLISSVLKNASTDAQKEINEIIQTLGSPQNKATISSLLASLFSEANSDKLNGFLNSAINGLDFKSIEQKLINDLLTDELSARIDSITSSAVRAAAKETEKPLSFIQKQATWLIILIVAAAAIIIFLIYHFRRKNLKSISNIMMAQIQNIEDKNGYESLTNNIKEMAMTSSLEPQLRKILKENGLLSNDDPENPKNKW